MRELEAQFLRETLTQLDISGLKVGGSRLSGHDLLTEVLNSGDIVVASTKGKC
jgi:hypothetical protein